MPVSLPVGKEIRLRRAVRMVVSIHEFQVTTEGFTDVVDISEQVGNAIDKSAVADGMALVSVAGSTASITSIEYEPGVVRDLKNAIERLAPSNIKYEHDARWGDGNGFAHVRAAMLGSSFSVPVHRGRAVLGTWQQIVLLDFDNKRRRRSIYVQIIGE